MRIVLALILMLATARADTVSGFVVDAKGIAITGARVRVIGERFIIVVSSGASGQFRIDQLPGGHYRIESDRGTVHDSPPVVFQLDHDRPWCVFPLPQRTSCLNEVCGVRLARRVRDFVAPTRGHVDTRSTAQGVRLTTGQILGR